MSALEHAVRSRRARATVAAIAAAVTAVAGFEAAAANPGKTFVVNSTSDALDLRPGDGSCAIISGACTLRAAVQEANALPGANVIEVPAGTYEIAIPPLNQNEILTGDLDITDSVAINGAGAASTIVDAGVPLAGAPVQVHGLDRVFEVSVDGGEVSFTGLTISDGYAAEYGGAIANNSTASVTVARSVLTRNVAGKAGGAIDNHLGGAVDVRDSTVTHNFANENGSAINNNRNGTLTVTGSTVSSNSAADVGFDESLMGAGAISNNAELDMIGTVTVSSSTMSDNRAGGGRSGGAIANDGAGTVTVDGTTFTKNVATGDGGAISSKSGEVTVTGSTFAENAAHDGGAIYNDGANEGRVTVRDAQFSLNSASARGGAVEGGGTGHVTIVDSTFSKNSADDLGGAVSSSDKAATTIVRSSFSENTGLSGGGFANEGSGPVIVENTTFTKNIAFEGIMLAAGEGGGMHSSSGGEVVITGGAFTGNHARGGGGLSNEGGGTLGITGTRFSDNRADEQGGGILIQSGAVRMLEIDVVGNFADGAEEGGGGIAYAGDKAIGIGETAALEHSRIRDNKAKGEGGGIDSRGDGPLVVTTTSITGNTAGLGGAIHHVGDAPLEVTRSTLSGNFADSGGGVFSDGDGEATIENSTVSGNRAGQFGGGLLVSSRLTVRSSTVASNTAASGGGINNGGGDLVGDGFVFLANTIVANSPTGGNCAGTMTSLGGNLESAATCRLSQLSDQSDTDPLLGPLADNGGPTRTHALLEGSLAQERAVCDELVVCPPVDQRGVVRPLFLGSDVGAYESELAPGGGESQPCAGRTERPVTADFDSWISQSAPSTNFGGDSLLKVETPGKRALVHFTLPSLPPGCRIVGARLRLHSPSATNARTLEALRVASGWDHLDVTWSNQPATAGPAATTVSGTGVREWDVLAQTLDMYALGNHGFLVRSHADSAGGEQSFHSTRMGADPPELVLVFDDPDAPPRPAVCPTTPQIISADRDSWVSQSSSSNNFGSDSGLKVKSQNGSNSRALIRFPLPVLPAGCTGVASAALRVEAASAKDGRTLQALQVASPWSETGVTWSNQPATRGRAATTPSAQGPLEWSVTDQVLDMYTSANYGLMIRDAQENGVGDEQTLKSREKVSDGPPELVLTFDDSTPETTIQSGPVSPTAATEATFEFTSDRADATFECSLDGASYKTCSSPHHVGGLAEGGHTFEVRSTRKVRAVDPTPARYAWGIAIPPETTIGGPASPSPSPKATLTFASDDPDATFECSRGGAPFAACASPLELSDLPDGPQEVRVRAIDPFGNVDATPAAHRWLVAVPPVTAITSRPADPSGSASATFEFAADEPATFECALGDGEWAACTSPRTYDGLSDGRHGFRVRATDMAGNPEVEPAGYEWTIDTVAPGVTIDGPPDPTRSTSASFTIATDETATLVCALDDGAFGECQAEYAGLGDGAHALQVRATDAAGNRTASRYGWTVDTTAPKVTVAGPPDPTNGTSATFVFEADEPAEFACALDADAFGACRAEYAELGEGPHVFQVRATDRAGNETVAEHLWTIDTTAPVVTLAGPPDPSRSATATFEFDADEPATFTCALDSEVFGECAARYDVLSEGAHSFRVRATDAAGNHASAMHEWTVDTVAPETEIVSGPADPTNSTTASFTFTAGEAASFECALDAAEFGECAPEYADLADGPHTFAVRATDVAGNTDATPAVYSWTVDTKAPAVHVDGPAEASDSSTATFTFGADEPARFECVLDSGAFGECAPEYADLSEGAHTFRVRATDAAGNDATAVHTWTVDTVAPTVTLLGPADPSNSSTAEFGVTADEPAKLECALDAAAFGECMTEYADLPDGRHTFAVRATDAAGNETNAGHAWTIDTVAPTVTIDGPDDPTNRTSAEFTVAADEPATFECALDSEVFGECAADYIGLGEGAHAFHVRATDRAGNAATATHRWTVDTTAPATTVRGPADPTNATTAAFDIAADEPATFQCALDSEVFGDCAAEYANLADGPHTLRVHATDAAGNDATAGYSWTIDTAAPETTIASGPSDPTNRTTASFAVAADEAATFECALDAGAFGACAPEYADLRDGAHSFRVRATDVAGNTDATPATYTWTVDTVAPTVTIDGPADPTSSTTASFAVAADEAAALACALDAGEFGECAPAYANLTDGRRTFYARATDAAGNQATETHSWTVDTVAPTVTIDGPAMLTNHSSAAFTLAANEPASFECAFDTATFGECQVEYTGLTDGEHTLRVRATDAAGNQATETHAWTIDTVAPAVTVEGPADPTNGTTAEFSFAADEPATFACALDTAAFGACAPAYADVADGRHTFYVRATDAAGNQATATHSWTIDTVAPTVTLDGPDQLTNRSTAAFTFSANEPATFECALDAAAFGDCQGEYAGLADGEHTLRVRATDAAGNQTTAEHSWTVDTVAPTVTVEGPADPTNGTTAEFSFEADEPAAFACALDTAAFGACAPAYADVADGRHTFYVRATDGAGNQATATHSWTVDTVSPTVTIDGPDELTNRSTAAFTFSANEPASFECAPDTAAFGDCQAEYADLTDGRHTLRVRATDAAGNQTTAEHSWTVDTVAPAATISDGPADPTASTSASFTFGADESARFECALDAGDWAACEPPAEYTGLALGEHSFRVRATDAAGNQGAPATYAWTIEPTHNPQPPETTITAQPANPSNNTTASFSFTGSGDGPPAQMTFECSLDGVAFSACTSPRPYGGLGDGTHTFGVRAVDFAGNVDQSPATYTWTVDTAAPQTTITAAPPATTSSTTAAFSFTSEPGATFECALDGGAFAACASPREYAGVANGGHTFSVRATDAAGNVDQTPATHSWTVDTIASQTTITSAPPATSASTSASFAFTASETGSTFECSLDGAAFAACTSPRAYAGLANGSHSFSVRARDAAGNTDATPATHNWTIAIVQGCGPAVTAAAAADAWVDENSPSNNKGTDSILKVQSKGPRDNFRALVRFTLPAVPQGCAIESATLRLFAASAKTGRTLHALRAASPWTESQVSWANQPGTLGAAAATASGQGYREWAVTALVQDMYAGANNGFLIRDSVEGQDSEQQFHSREKGENPPQLVIRFTASG